ncbi:MAG: thermonuclease family protein [Planctomycetes bacterium]|nr:thermonuclease family protein [Planctomycetota bacterium]MBU4399296.1 thermonuclease family protein [Planctomycetota bacterium]MCG2683708.1 thermonuclease family protein [Planctomycetales bacterium]
MSRPRRFRSMRFPRRPGQAALLVALVLLLAAVHQWRPEPFESSAPRPLEAGLHRVRRVIDGDTFLLADAPERIRLIGADTPETVKPNHTVEPWGPEAAQFTKDFLAAGEVRLEFDGPSRDKYGRILAYAWVGDRMLNEELIRAGLASAEPWHPYSAAMKDRFRRAEGEARAARRRIWSAER